MCPDLRSVLGARGPRAPPRSVDEEEIEELRRKHGIMVEAEGGEETAAASQEVRDIDSCVACCSSDTCPYVNLYVSYSGSSMQVGQHGLMWIHVTMTPVARPDAWSCHELCITSAWWGGMGPTALQVTAWAPQPASLHSARTSLATTSYFLTAATCHAHTMCCAGRPVQPEGQRQGPQAGGQRQGRAGAGRARVRLQVRRDVPLVPAEDAGGPRHVHAPQLRRGQAAAHQLLVSHHLIDLTCCSGEYERQLPVCGCVLDHVDAYLLCRCRSILCISLTVCGCSPTAAAACDSVLWNWLLSGSAPTAHRPHKLNLLHQHEPT